METESFDLIEVRKSVGKTIKLKICNDSWIEEKLIQLNLLALSLTLYLILHGYFFSINIIDLILIENKTKMNINYINSLQPV